MSLSEEQIAEMESGTLPHSVSIRALAAEVRRLREKANYWEMTHDEAIDVMQSHINRIGKERDEARASAKSWEATANSFHVDYLESQGSVLRAEAALARAVELLTEIEDDDDILLYDKREKTIAFVREHGGK